MADNILYKLRSGKPIKFLDFIKNFSGLLIPDVWYRSRRERMLAEARRRPDYAYMQKRVDYYIRIHALGLFLRKINRHATEAGFIILEPLVIIAGKCFIQLIILISMT